MGTLNSIATNKALVLKENTSLVDAARAMHKKSVGSSLVSNGSGHIIGIITDRDIACKGIAFNYSPKDKIETIMNKHFIYISENGSVNEAVKLMKEFGIRRLPIIKTMPNGKNRCSGILSFDDLILSEEASIRDLKEVLSGQFKKAAIRKVKKTKSVPEFPSLPRELQPIITI